MSEAMIQLSQVSKVYRTSNGEVRALDDVTVNVPAGSFTAVCGPSGCGKSTMLSLIGGLALANSGRVIVAGQELNRLSSAERAKFRAHSIGFVFQMFHLLPYLSVIENVLVAAPNAVADGVTEHANQLLKQFGLQPRREHRPSELSTGERQRVAMARALLNRPQLLLADEPTGNLDPQNAAIVLDTLAEFHRGGGTVVLVTHEQSATDRAESTIFLELGKLRTN